MNVIEFNNVSKKFKKGERFNSLRDSIPNFFRNIVSKNKNKEALDSKEFWAVKDVSFNIKKGDVLGIIGPNGAGKSTILKLLSRIMNPTKGEMKITGRLSALIEVTAGFHNELTGRENTYLNGTILGMTRKEIDSKFDEILEFSGIGEFIDTPVKRYSSGMYSRLGFSVAAHMNPDILLVDEVLSVGDIAFQAKCAQKMRELLDSGTTIILVSHNISLIQSLCKRVILLDKGEILKDGGPEEVIPFYESIIYAQREEELKKQIAHSDYKVKLDEELPVKISNVLIYNGTLEKKDSFSIG
ncbi:MAG TPA: ABC transporter ATP-binding protein, partial [Candidatus Omnitrophica bacterium]|nr:ABC transporter ATP-binding protein [Candidatus Omnitrophota bacterium]